MDVEPLLGGRQEAAPSGSVLVGPGPFRRKFSGLCSAPAPACVFPAAVARRSGAWVSASGYGRRPRPLMMRDR
jgi:hypothetical protein